MKACKPEYLAKALLLSEQEKERLLSRMGGKLPSRLDKNKISVDEALALQLEIEDEQLDEWRGRMRDLKAKDLQKSAKEPKKKQKAEEAVAETPKKEPKSAAPKAPAKQAVKALSKVAEKPADSRVKSKARSESAVKRKPGTKT